MVSRALCQIRQFVKLDPRAGPLSNPRTRVRALSHKSARVHTHICLLHLPFPSRATRRPMAHVTYPPPPTPRYPSRTSGIAAVASRVPICQISVKFLSNSAGPPGPLCQILSNPVKSAAVDAARGADPSKFRGRRALCQILSNPVKSQTSLGPLLSPSG